MYYDPDLKNHNSSLIYQLLQTAFPPMRTAPSGTASLQSLEAKLSPPECIDKRELLQKDVTTEGATVLSAPPDATPAVATLFERLKECQKDMPHSSSRPLTLQERMAALSKPVDNASGPEIEDARLDNLRHKPF
jgi:hypothetical protein